MAIAIGLIADNMKGDIVSALNTLNELALSKAVELKLVIDNAVSATQAPTVDFPILCQWQNKIQQAGITNQINGFIGNALGVIFSNWGYAVLIVGVIVVIVFGIGHRSKKEWAGKFLAIALVAIVGVSAVGFFGGFNVSPCVAG